MTLSTTTHICQLVLNDNWRMLMLSHARDVGLPDWGIGAGFVRAAVWDALTDKPESTDLPDLDLIYFDPENTDPDRDRELAAHLRQQTGSDLWDVKNQARMHLRNSDPPYHNTIDALFNWLETPTCIAVRLEQDGTLTLLAPHGVEDLLALRVRPTPAGLRYPDKYRERMASKKWDELWPGLTVKSV